MVSKKKKRVSRAFWAEKQHRRNKVCMKELKKVRCAQSREPGVHRERFSFMYRGLSMEWKVLIKFQAEK